MTPGNFQAGDELRINNLTAGTASGIAFRYANGVLTLTGPATLAGYPKVLRSVKLLATGGAGTLRTLKLSVGDGDLTSAEATRNVVVM